MPRMYHPAHGGVEDVPDDDATVAVLKQSGWELAPEPETAPGLVPEPVTFAPVAAKPEPKAKGSKPTPDPDGD